MADMPERIVVWYFEHRKDKPMWLDADSGHGGTQYVRADLYEAQQERIQFLENALGQAVMYEEWVYSDERRCPELAKYLKEKKEDA